MKTIVFLSLAVAVGTGCGSRLRPQVQEASVAAPAATDRSIVRTADLVVSVKSPDSVAAAVERLISEAGGYVERSSGAERRMVLHCRVPAARLDQTMDRIAVWGDVQRRSVSAVDVTEEHADLEARLRTSTALRDRLRELLDRATGVADVLAIERELARVQAEVESLQGRLDRLKSQVELSVLTITLERTRILGPLGYVAYGVGWVLGKLFIIR